MKAHLRPTVFKPLIFAAVTIMSVACSSRHNVQRIEIFQIIDSKYDIILNEEMRRETALYKDIDFVFHTSASTPQEQGALIEGTVKSRPAAIIVMGHEARAILPAIESAYDAGVKVVILGDKVDSGKYTAFIGRNDQEEGKLIGNLIKEKLPDGGIIAEIISNESKEYGQDFLESMNNSIANGENLKIEVFEDTEELEKFIGNSEPDLLFAADEKSSNWANHSLPFSRICRIGMNGNMEWGIRSVKESEMYACLINQTGGAIAINTTVSILKGLRFEKDFYLTPIVLTPRNVDLAAIGFQENHDLIHKVDIINENLKELRRRNENYSLILIGMIALFGLLLSVIKAMEHIKAVENDKKHKEAMDVLAAEKMKLKSINEINEIILKDLKEENSVLLDTLICQDNKNYLAKDPVNDAVFMNRLNKLIESEFSDTDLSIESMAKTLGLSRTQLYRKVKAASGSTPNELLRDFRLAKGKEFLAAKDVSISEVAYSVGFSSPSYFTKCYKDKYGESPSTSKL